VSLLEAFVLGVVQGATEFLPVSSSGHLVVGQTLLDVRVPGVVFEVAVHLATLVSVLVVYRGRVTSLVSGAIRGRSSSWRYLGLLVLATVPAAVIGLFFEDPVEVLFERPEVTGFALLITGALLWSTRRALARGDWMGVGATVAVVMGLAQALALVPGISRSGTTVVAGLWMGVAAEDAAEFSFLMAVPAIAGAALLQVPELLQGMDGHWAWALGVGGIAAAVTGVAAIRAFVATLRRRSFHFFGLYCWLVGGLFLLYLLGR
jgi:undecaprenyl-diphosphatase